MKDEPGNIKRRKILTDGATLLGLAASGGLISALLSGCEATTLKSTGTTFDFDISTEPALSTVGGAVKKKLGDKNFGNPVIIIHKTTNEFVVLTAVCTFEGCTVDIPVNPDSNIVCPCCRSEYSTFDGHVIKGPASAALRTFVSSYDASLKILKITF